MTAQNAVTTIEPNGAPAVAPRNAITPMQMLQIAVEQNADLDKLTKLMDLQERWEANEARKAFVAALNAFKADPPTVVKNKSVRFGRGDNATAYDHATLDQVAAVIGAALSEHGLSHRWEVQQLEGGQIRVTCVLTHAMGHSERVSLQAGADQSGAKNNIQAIGSTVTYLERYTLLAITGLAAKGQDSDGGGPVAFITPEQAAELQRVCEEVGADKVKFVRFFAADSFADIPASQYQQARAMLDKKRSAK